MTHTDGFRHETFIVVRFHDIDALGHVNNARYLNYMEQARLAYAKDVCGWDGKMNTLGLIVANVTIDFKHPIFMTDILTIYTRVSRLGNKSFDMEYRFISTPAGNQDSVLTAQAKTTMVTYDYSENKSVPIFSDWREAILNFDTDVIG